MISFSANAIVVSFRRTSKLSKITLNTSGSIPFRKVLDTSFWAKVRIMLRESSVIFSALTVFVLIPLKNLPSTQHSL